MTDGMQHPTMKAAIYTQYGGPEVVQIQDVDRPVPESGEVLVRIRATTVASGDWRMRSAIIPEGFGLIAPLVFGRKPKRLILGTELAGTIAAVGNGIESWRVGDAVFAFPGGKMGAHAEYICLPAERLGTKPANLSFEEAAALSFGGSTALSFIEKGGGIRRGERVLVVGASGCVGSAMVQLAKHYGAKITGVCSGANAQLVRSLGANDVIDYAKEDFALGNQTYDVIVDTIGTAPIRRALSLLNRRGRLLLVYAGFGDMLRAPWVSLTQSKRVVAGPATEDPRHLPQLAELARAGVFKPVIDRTYAFDQIVEAHRHVDTGHKKGSVVITLPTSDEAAASA